jgi:hypothetical protein
VNDDALGPRFPSVSDAYDEVLQDMVLAAAKELDLSYKVRPDGTYCFVSGPCYESKSESRFLRSIGGDTVGMSTVPEVVAAKHCGMKVLGLSLITNAVVTGKEQTVAASHEEVLAEVQKSGVHVEAIVRKIINKTVIGPYLAQQPDFVYTPTKKAAAPAGGCCAKKACTKCGPNCQCGANCQCNNTTTITAGTGKCGKVGGCCCGPTCACGPNCQCTADFCSPAAAGKCCPGKKCCVSGGCDILPMLAFGAILAGLFVVVKAQCCHK